MTYRERREAKAERLQEWAAKREAKAGAGWERAHELGSVIPFGQPILVGHHSEGRDRRYRARVGAMMDRALDDARRAVEFGERSEGIRSQLERSIYDDDPDAVDRLRERVAALEAERDRIKAENSAYRKAHKAELAGLTAFGRDRAMPHPGYVLKNLSGNIKRNRDRLARLEQLPGAPDVSRQMCGRCGAGPFFFVASRDDPTLCLDCSADADRGRCGWTPENSLS